jgi:hypothetical protein
MITKLSSIPQAEQWQKTINGKTINEWPYKVVGGPCVIRRKVWNDGNRYSEAAWTNHGDENTIAEQEDVKFSRQLQSRRLAGRPHPR